MRSSCRAAERRIARAQWSACAGPSKVDTGLVSDRPAVMTRRDIEHVSRAELEPSSVSQLQGDTSGEDDSHMTGLPPLAADERAQVHRPAPPRLRDDVADG